MPVRNDFSPNWQYEIAVCCRDNPKVHPLSVIEYGGPNHCAQMH